MDITKKKVPNAQGKLVKLDIDQHRQKMGMVFQHFNLFPHMTILDNMTLAPIQVKHMDKAAAKEKALALLDRVGLKDRAGAYPIQLSGGQKQRVAIVRALAMEPEVMLFDEPLAALDLKLRKDMQIELKRIQQQVGITFIYVTQSIENQAAMVAKVKGYKAGFVTSAYMPPTPSAGSSTSNAAPTTISSATTSTSMATIST